MLVLRADGLSRVAAPSEYLRSLLADNSARNTIKARAGDLALWWRWCIDHTANALPAPIEPMSAAAADLTVFVLRLQTTPKRYPLTTPIRVMPGDKRARSSRTIARIIDSIKQFYLWAARGHGMIPDATAKQMLNFKTPRVIDVATVDRLQPPLVRRVLAIPRGIRGRFLLELLYGTGIREGEALGLRLEDIHLCADNAAIFNCSFPGGAHLHVVRRRNPNGHCEIPSFESRSPYAPSSFLLPRVDGGEIRPIRRPRLFSVRICLRQGTDCRFRLVRFLDAELVEAHNSGADGPGTRDSPRPTAYLHIRAAGRRSGGANGL